MPVYVCNEYVKLYNSPKVPKVIDQCLALLNNLQIQELCKCLLLSMYM